MKKLYQQVYLVFFSFLFSLQCISFINQPGDQTWFRNIANKYDYQYFEFAIDRYFNWSSRLLIESATMFFSTHYIIFDIILFLFTYFLFYVLSDIVTKEEKDSNSLPYIIPILFLFLFPTNFFLGAGLIATITNYYFPMVLFVLSFWFMQNNKLYSFIISIFLLIISTMQEQFAVLSSLLYVFLIFQSYKLYAKLNKVYLASVIVSINALVIMFLSPGSKIRTLIETKRWYPGFNKMSLFKKISLGFFDTNQSLFLGDQINAVFLLLVILVILAVYKKDLFILISNLLLLLVLVLEKAGMKTLFFSTKRVVSELDTYKITPNLIYIWLIYLTILVFLAISIYRLIDNKVLSVKLIVLVISGYIARMTVSFSPTIYSSGIRTHLPILFGIFIVILYLIRELNHVYVNPKILES
ncbi:hypothetical protein [Streptococcus uberis]|uniref:Membrane protein n=1 Tax=Streptococcus uberis (strain ATCC BAA-854 / 0140J) TaxID=218495 RepID=B9DU31_STRU0|nr:hypothetical protein [Streptococcus uberis]AUC24795.1 hypothetical protein CGZ53_03690 [Streptococcus uberis]KKF42400.1 hypothetical protein AF63_03495 [Streptococcus uberis Ab71]KKF48513.1 hypothetical protein AF59_06420 [Streptococcus uberis C5072]KKF49593.1 hypothetical protein AF62_03575 [Streptococcus uberis C8329]KKF50615.1 hypothetical protein AF60_06490 [Streptococcus uberis S6261]